MGPEVLNFAIRFHCLSIFFATITYCVIVALCRAPLAVQPSNFLMKTWLTKGFHACGNVVTGILWPSPMVTIPGCFNSCSEFFHEDSHRGVNVFIEALPVIFHAFLKTRKFGNLCNPPRAAVTRHVIIDEVIELVSLAPAMKRAATIPQRTENQFCVFSLMLIHVTTA